MNNLTVITLSEPNITDFAAARNAALAKAKTEWVLFVDQDETLTPALKQEISQATKTTKYTGYYLMRSDQFLGATLKHGETANTRFLRLARRESGQWERPVHEVWKIKGRVGELKNPLIHNPHASISAFLQKIDKYSELESVYRYSQGFHSSLFHIAFYPLAKFAYNYLWLRGNLDGVPGLIMAILMSFHSYLTWTKLYLLWHKK